MWGVAVRGAWTAAIAVVLSACGGSGDSERDDERRATVTVAASSAPATSTGASATAGTSNATQIAATPGASPTAPPEAARAAAVLRALIGPGVEADCDPQARTFKDCLGLTSNEETLAGGIAVFTVYPPSGDGFVVLMGRQLGGEWGVYVATQNGYQLGFLPGTLRVCAGGEVLNVRSGPHTDGSPIFALPDGALATAKRFVLTKAGTLDTPGEGWYFITSPQEGWVFSRFVSNASYPDCALHDAQEP